MGSFTVTPGNNQHCSAKCINICVRRKVRLSNHPENNQVPLNNREGQMVHKDIFLLSAYTVEAKSPKNTMSHAQYVKMATIKGRRLALENLGKDWVGKKHRRPENPGKGLDRGRAPAQPWEKPGERLIIWKTAWPLFVFLRTWCLSLLYLSTVA